MRRIEKNALLTTGLRREEQYRLNNRDGLAEFNARIVSLQTGAPLDGIVKPISSATATRRLAANGGGFVNISTLPQDSVWDVVSFGVLFPGNFDFTAECIWNVVSYSADDVDTLCIAFMDTQDINWSGYALGCRRDGSEMWHSRYENGIRITNNVLFAYQSSYVGALKYRFRKNLNTLYVSILKNTGVWTSEYSITHNILSRPLYLGTYTHDYSGVRAAAGFRNFVLNSDEAIYVGV